MNKLIKLGFIITALVLSLCITSCSDSDESEQNLVTPSTAGLSLISSTRSSPNMLGFDIPFCFTINYPLSFTLPDQSTIEVGSDAELFEFIEQWFEENDPNGPQPNLNYPLSITTFDGEESINSDDEFVEILETCISDFIRCFGDFNSISFEDLCFAFTYPIEIICADGTSDFIEDADDEPCGGDLDPANVEIIYPIEITYPDGSTESIDSQEEFSEVVTVCFNDILSNCD